MAATATTAWREEESQPGGEGEREKEKEMGVEGPRTGGDRGGTAAAGDTGPAGKRLSSIGKLRVRLRAGG